MDSLDETRGAASGLADLSQVPLADIRVMSDDALSQALWRIVADESTRRVAVAAFNSSI